MEKDSCQHFRSLLKKEELSQEEDQQLIEHIETCIHCQNYIDMTEKNEPIPALPNERNILRKAKWKQRWNQLSFLLGIVVFVYLVGSIFSALYYGIGDRGERINAVSSLAFQALNPGLEVGSSTTKIGTLFNQQRVAELQKTIGREQHSVGKLHTNARFSFVNQSIEWNNGSMKDQFAFVHPDYHEKLEDDIQKEYWEVLEKLPEGTVTELAISFTHTLTVEEVYKEINKEALNEDLYDITWYALDTGYEYKRKTDDPFLIREQIFGFPSNIELYPNREEYSDETLEEDVVKMMKLLKDHQKWVEPFYNSGENQEIKLNERYEYVKKNSVKTYGIVITGPTKELLKLKDGPFIRFVTVGETELWNWYSPHFQGQRFSY
ncbi:anti-sigma factor [Bacillus sp. FJAT-42315]|uniref:anti-sigma factor n=1 Tax=Bacillus sp. FJAT-42315 TaxID=2014077 RepID=UPI000C24A3EC|nr:anti-sigma factor [Bacillus sp. FJAT-42315]